MSEKVVFGAKCSYLQFILVGLFGLLSLPDSTGGGQNARRGGWFILRVLGC